MGTLTRHGHAQASDTRHRPDPGSSRGSTRSSPFAYSLADTWTCSHTHTTETYIHNHDASKWLAPWPHSHSRRIQVDSGGPWRHNPVASGEQCSQSTHTYTWPQSHAAIRVHQLRQQGQVRRRHSRRSHRRVASHRKGPDRDRDRDRDRDSIPDPPVPHRPLRSRSRSRSRLNPRSSRPTSATQQCARGTSRTVGTHC